MSTLIRKFNIKDVCIISIICMIYLFSRYSYRQVIEQVPNVKDIDFEQISGQENKWIPGMGGLEYLPTKAFNNRAYIATRQDGIVILDGECEINENKVKTNDKPVLLELPYIYYPGYTVRFDGVPIQTFETENGFIGIEIEENDSGTIDTKYTGTKLMHITKMISLVAFVGFVVYVSKKR